MKDALYKGRRVHAIGASARCPICARVRVEFPSKEDMIEHPFVPKEQKTRREKDCPAWLPAERTLMYAVRT